MTDSVKSQERVSRLVSEAFEAFQPISYSYSTTVDNFLVSKENPEGLSKIEMARNSDEGLTDVLKRLKAHAKP